MHKVEQRARELLAQHEQQDKTGGAPVVRRDDALRAIASALSQQPEARGVVDVDKVFHAVSAYVSPADRSYFRAVLTAAITGERNG